MTFKAYRADCLDVLRKLPDNHVSAIVTDPPYGLGVQTQMTHPPIDSYALYRTPSEFTIQPDNHKQGKEPLILRQGAVLAYQSRRMLRDWYQVWFDCGQDYARWIIGPVVCLTDVQFEQLVPLALVHNE